MARLLVNYFRLVDLNESRDRRQLRFGCLEFLAFHHTPKLVMQEAFFRFRLDLHLALQSGAGITRPLLVTRQ
jgi:hypothetical protein